MLLQAKDIRVSEADFNMEFVSRIIPKIDWNALYTAADGVCVSLKKIN